MIVVSSIFLYLFSTFVLFSQVSLAHDDSSTKCAWENCFKWIEDNNIIKVHILSHTHDDMGWIKTFDEYYTGSNRKYSPVGVQYILNTVTSELLSNPSRKFVYAETGFLQTYLEDHGSEELEKLRKLISETGQLELVGGGWVQPDEAASHYVELVDQYTLGLRKLNATFGACGIPKAAWQIDPFGHSREHASLLSLMGYESVYFSRQHFTELADRIKNKSLEFMWNTSDDLNTKILTGSFSRGTYAPPNNFCFDILCEDEPIVDNIRLSNYNINKKAELFASIVKDQVSGFKHNHALMTMGGDFQYTNSNRWFINLEKLIKHINSNSSYGMQLFYSTVSCYTKAISEAVELKEWPVKQADFFPYATYNNGYWTGYFTSKPTFKHIIRESSALLQLMRKMNVFAGRNNFSSQEEVLERAISLSIHHDGVTGTAKDFVTKDYQFRLFQAQNVAEISISESLKLLAQKTNITLPDQIFCHLLNETVCDATNNKTLFVVVLFNGNSRPVNSHLVRIPYSFSNATVYDFTGRNRILSGVSISFVPGTQFDYQKKQAQYELSFAANIPPLGFTSFFVHRSEQKLHKLYNEVSSISNNLISLEFDARNGLLKKFIDKKRNRTFSLNQNFYYYEGTFLSGAYVFSPEQDGPIEVSENGAKISIVKNELYEEVRQIFSPYVSQVIRLWPNKSFVEFDFIVGPLPKNDSCLRTHELITRYSVDNFDSKSQFMTDANGRQMMKRWRNFAPDFKFDTKNWVSGNYYPVTSQILIEDSNNRVVVLTDRSQGGTSLKDGEIELMLHRRTFNDDNLGVGEPLDELGEDGRGLVMRGTHWLIIEPIQEKNVETNFHYRPMALELFHKPLYSFSGLADEDFEQNIKNYCNNFKTWYSFLANGRSSVEQALRFLPPQINLLTLKWLAKNVLLLRLEHIYQSYEISQTSQNVTFNLQDLFDGNFEIVGMEELMLAANRPTKPSNYILKNSTRLKTVQLKMKKFGNRQKKNEFSKIESKWIGRWRRQRMQKLKLARANSSEKLGKLETDESKLWNDTRRLFQSNNLSFTQSKEKEPGFFVELKPMQIRTFKLTVQDVPDMF